MVPLHLELGMNILISEKWGCEQGIGRLEFFPRIDFLLEPLPWHEMAGVVENMSWSADLVLLSILTTE
ncbi:hypothetical protein SUGI_0595680 [Cryptomeria japonica]|nr:hypothetical protein SUGI_0595680 [Cryptomeria japonica]